MEILKGLGGSCWEAIERKRKRFTNRKGTAQTDLMSRGKTLRRPRDRAKNQQWLHTLHPWMYTAHLQVGPHQDASRLFHNIHWHYMLLCTLPCFSCCSVLPTHKIVWDSCLPLGFYKGKASHTLTSKSNGVWSSSSSPKNSLLVFCSTPRRPQDSHSYGSYHLRNKMSVCVDNPSNHKECSFMVKDKESLQEEGEDSSQQVSKSFFTADLTQGSMFAEDLTTVSSSLEV